MANETKPELRIRVPADKKEKYSRMVYTAMYLDDSEDKAIYLALKTNPKTPISEIVKILKVTHPTIRRRYTAIRQMAINCGLPFTEG